jgi:hypothetical protein
VKHESTELILKELRELEAEVVKDLDELGRML